MIAIDDMRPELGNYGCDHMVTPNIDALAVESLVFDNAYVAVAWCSPSRTALLTSRRPDTSMTWSVVPSEYWRERGGNFSTLPQYFKEHGYLTLGLGKIFHAGAASGNDDVAYSWSSESLPYSQGGSRGDCTAAVALTRPNSPTNKLSATSDAGAGAGDDAGLVGDGSEVLPAAAAADGVGDVTPGGAAMTPAPAGPDDNIPCTANATLHRIAANRVRCAFSDRNLHSRMPLDPTPARLKRARSV
jgi:hypothetical protein